MSKKIFGQYPSYRVAPTGSDKYNFCTISSQVSVSLLWYSLVIRLVLKCLSVSFLETPVSIERLQ